MHLNSPAYAAAITALAKAIAECDPADVAALLAEEDADFEDIWSFDLRSELGEKHRAFCFELEKLLTPSAA